MNGNKIYDIGENMGILKMEDKGFTLINKDTGKTRQFVYGNILLVNDKDIDFTAAERTCPHLNHLKLVRYGFGRVDNFHHGVCVLYWVIYPDGQYFADEDGFGMEDNDEEKVYCVINKNLEIIVPFQPMNKETLNRYMYK